MSSTEILQYISFGFALLVAIFAFSASDWLWKRSFFYKCFFAAIFSGVAGVVFEFSNLFQTKRGLTIVVMFVPLIYLGYFQFFRWIFKKWKGTEPYITSASSMVGRAMLEFSSAQKDGKTRKYPKGRKVMAADFLFSFLQGLVPIFTIFILLFYVFEVQKK